MNIGDSNSKFGQVMPVESTPARRPPNIFGALIGGLIGGILGMVAWGGVTALLNARYAYLALLVGLLVAAGMILLGRARGFIYALLAAVITLLALLGGNILTQVLITARDTNTPIMDVVQLLIKTPSLVTDVLQESATTLNVIMSIVSIIVAFIVTFSGELNRNRRR
jgi:hypothetical protein